ncbi:hypothetical protein K432DRAFT_182319 [Lepidopterella palustris CBS 459.81]|uniref:Uncharacterized protein n=1 Tax=Lepidopterella palustris CBS 459.81 TaxID=1314670 RepID=A0A8E2E090_9PEZI|nr:hypothetical protein K432DRAFT_182319 [Lepidopterella palustris CBS 459.81]
MVEVVSLKRTKTLTFVDFKPVPVMRHPKPWDLIPRFIQIFKHHSVFVAVCVFCFGWYWWILSTITVIPSAYAQIRTSNPRLLFITLILSTAFSDIFCSGRLSDWLTLQLAKKNKALECRRRDYSLPIKLQLPVPLALSYGV